MNYRYFILPLCALLASCNFSAKSSSQTNQQAAPKVSEFDDYWFQSLAEISSYKLEQARYGEIHQGHAMNVFVTEPFNTKKHVKADNAMANNVQSALKLNHTRKFNTGIYPYSTMTSSFTPVDEVFAGSTYKVTATVQEWCGQVFMQMNKKNSGFNIHLFSYFESEGDDNINIENCLLEDEIMSIIRINPKGLPIGNQLVLPSSLMLRLLHKEMKPYKAIISLSSQEYNGVKTNAYKVNFPELQRDVTYYFTEAFPYMIEGWEDSYRGFRGPRLTTKATRQHTILDAYWNKNSVVDTTLYNKLLDF